MKMIRDRFFFLWSAFLGGGGSKYFWLVQNFNVIRFINNKIVKMSIAEIKVEKCRI